jgi:Caspase domain/Domain of unknown function (DUF4384)
VKRRDLLQFGGVGLAWSAIELEQMALRYGQAIAQTTPRKLALLVGINTYPVQPLYGCVTDVELQRQLLVHRFGFNPKDIMILTDRRATRQAILTAFEEHLIKQARPGDVVVFHYSGHGSLVADPDHDEPDGLNGSFVPVDAITSRNGQVRHIMGHTLFLLMRAINTDNLTVVLDSCFSGGGIRGNMLVRALPAEAKLRAVEDLKYQQQLLGRLQLSADQFKKQRRQGIARGMMLYAAQRNQTAMDVSFDDFSAGAFTYALTRSLWQQSGTTSIRQIFPQIRKSTLINSGSFQRPGFATYRADQDQVYLPDTAQGTEAIVLSALGRKLKLWLGGLDTRSLQVESLDLNGPTGVVRLKLGNRKGLVAEAELLEGSLPAVGSPLQESARTLPDPKTVKLALALDDTLTGGEVVGFSRELSRLQFVEVVSLRMGRTVDIILGRLAENERAQAANSGILPIAGALGFFNEARIPIPLTFGPVGESVADSIERLIPRLKAQLAVRLVRLLLNPDSTKLNVAASIVLPDEQNRLVVKGLTRSAEAAAHASASPTPLLKEGQLPLKTRFQVEFYNGDTKPVYLTLLAIDVVGQIDVLYPNDFTENAVVRPVAPITTVRIPTEKDGFDLVTLEPKGLTEILVIASLQPFNVSSSLKATLQSLGGDQRGPVSLNDPLQAAGELMTAFGSTRSKHPLDEERNTGSQARILSTDAVATLSLTFEVI